MMNRRYILTFFILDRISKLLAIRYLTEPLYINKYISLNLAINNGLALGILNSFNYNQYIIYTILFMLSFLVVYTYIRYNNRYSIVAEYMILTGSISNLIDRILYNGVVDFIDIHFNNIYIPIFNIADLMIITGIFIIFINILFNNQR
jgi:signal peptidase II